MSEVHFFMTEDDTVFFCRFLVDRFRCDFTADGVLRPELQVLTDPIKVAAARDPDGYHARFFVRSAAWSSYPLVLYEIHHNDGRHRWYVRQRYGGPAFDFSVARDYSSTESAEILPGWFMDYPWYFATPESNERIPRPPKMKKAAESVRAYLRRQGVRTASKDGGRPGPWALSGAVAAFKAGASLRWGDARYQPDPKV